MRRDFVDVASPPNSAASSSDRRRRLLPATETALLSLITDAIASPFTPSAETLVVSDARASADERVAVYAYMYRSRIAEALESQFPRLAMLLGGEPFAELAFAYVTDHPSRNPSLRYLGAFLPDWLERRRPQAPWLADLARLEWARSDLFDLADEPTLTIDGLRAWPQDQFAQLPLKLVAAHRIITVDYAIADFWKRIGADDGVAVVDVPDEAETSCGESLLVWRLGTSVFHRAVGAVERQALEMAAAGTTFGLVCDALPSPPEQTVQQAFTFLASWTTDELLRAVV